MRIKLGDTAIVLTPEDLPYIRKRLQEQKVLGLAVYLTVDNISVLKKNNLILRVNTVDYYSEHFERRIEDKIKRGLLVCKHHSLMKIKIIALEEIVEIILEDFVGESFKENFRQYFLDKRVVE